MNTLLALALPVMSHPTTSGADSSPLSYGEALFVLGFTAAFAVCMLVFVVKILCALMRKDEP